MQKLNFLVADDAGFIRDLVKRALKSQFSQCQIDEAVNGRKTQSLITRNRYDLVLCDWEMPELSGLEVLQWLRAEETARGDGKTPFIMVTSRGDKSHVVQAVEAGVSDYIGKPFSNDQLLRKVFKALSVNHKGLIRSILKGQAAMAKPQTVHGESASVLTAGMAKEAPQASTSDGSANVLTAGSVSSKLAQTSGKQTGKTATTTKAVLRSSKGQWPGVVRDINLTQVAIQFAFEEVLPPGLLDQVVVDLQMPNQPDSVARINGFVTDIALKEQSRDCRRANVGVKFVDDDPQKMEWLSRLVAAVRR
ncbi:MAG: response regulator [Saccharospirillum sp.]|nr:response regulator [Saccharospirillum sp.]